MYFTSFFHPICRQAHTPTAPRKCLLPYSSPSPSTQSLLIGKNNYKFLSFLLELQYTNVLHLIISKSKRPTEGAHRAPTSTTIPIDPRHPAYARLPARADPSGTCHPPGCHSTRISPAAPPA